MDLILWRHCDAAPGVPDDDELAAHRAYLEALARESKSGCLWLSLESAAVALA
jgi:hypothetical protein